MIKVILYQK